MLAPFRHEEIATFHQDRPIGADEDVHMTRGLVSWVIEECSSPGDLILDPFAGFGTTLGEALKLGRRAVGVELLPERVEYLKDHFSKATAVEGDARQLGALVSEPVDLILTSPPYMTSNEHPEDALSGYRVEASNYQQYLRDLSLVAQQCAQLLVPGGLAVWNVANIRYLGTTTTLAWDVAAVVGRHLDFQSETVVLWDELPHDFTGDYLLTFRKEG